MLNSKAHFHPVPQVKVIPIDPQQAGASRASQVSAFPDLTLERVKQFLQASSFAPSTQRMYWRELERFATWSRKAWADVTPNDVIRYKRYLKEDYRTPQGKPLMPASINQALTALKSFYQWFQDSGYLDLQAVLPTAAARFEKLGKTLPKHLSAEQMSAIAAVVGQGEDEVCLRDRALLAILTHGLRAGDISALNVGNYQGLRLQFVRDKDATEAIVPLRAAARREIDAYLEWRRQEQREVLSEDSPLLLSHDFRSPGQRLGYQGIYYFCKHRLGEAADIPDLTPHRFRHTYASELVELGIDTLLARALTGHRSERVFQRYIQGKRLTAAEEAFFRAVGEQQEASTPAALPIDSPLQGSSPPLAQDSIVLDAQYEVIQDLDNAQQGKGCNNSATVILWLRVENNNKFIRRKKKVREEIERLYLSAYRMKHLEGWEYELTIPYTSDLHLDEQIEELLGEISCLADNHCCFIEADVSEVGGERSW